MKKAYLESNVINEALRKSISGNEIRKKLKSNGFQPIIGLHTIYELTRTFQNPKNIEKGKNLFTIVKELQPSTMPEPKDLINQEIMKLRLGSAVLPFLSYENQIASQLEVDRLSKGIIEQRTLDFIINRELDMKKKFPIITEAYIRKHANEMRKLLPNQQTKL